MDPELPTPAAAAAAPTAVPFASSPPLPALQQQQPAPDNAINGHPPYAVMIKTALTSMKEKAGSSKKAIAKYIERNYSNLPPTHSALLGTHLRRLKKSGALEMVRKSYKLTSNVNGGGGSAVLNSAVRSAGLGSGLVGNGAGTSASGSKRPRGRPPKVKVEAEADSAAAAAQAAAQPMLVALGLADEPKKSRGRPKKNVVGGEGSSGAVSGTVTASGEKRRPGRPPRDKSAVKEKPKGVEPNRGQGKKAIGVPVMIPYAPEPVATGAGTVNLPTPVGGVGGPAVAPPNSGTVGGANYVGVAGGAVSAWNIGVYHVGVAGVPKRRGRPKKETAETGAGVGAGSGSVAGVGSGAAIGGDLPRRRGRPPRVAKVVVAPVKKRGRPQRTNKAAEIPKKKRGRPPVAKWVQKLGKSTGRHMGRPRKIVSTEAGNSQAAASRDLMRKLDYFQSKIKEAVLKLRPHMPSESVEAVAAIQELEGLAALDVNAPFGEAAQQPQIAED